MAEIALGLEQALADRTGKVLDSAFDCGFGDISNFNRAFRAEFVLAPVAFRRASPPR